MRVSQNEVLDELRLTHKTNFSELASHKKN